MNKQLASKNIKLTCRAFAALPDTKNKATSANMEKRIISVGSEVNQVSLIFQNGA